MLAATTGRLISVLNLLESGLPDRRLEFCSNIGCLTPYQACDLVAYQTPLLQRDDLASTSFGAAVRQFQAVIFDMDGLLLDTERIALSSFIDTCAQFGLGDQMDLFIRCIGTNQALGQQVLREGLGGRVDPLHFEHVWDTKYVKRTSNTPIPLKDGAIELLQQVATLQIPTAVATSTASARAAQKLRDAGISNYFAAIVGGDQVANSKPCPDIYLRAAAILRVKPETCLALEDSDNGVRSALSAGMTVVQVPDLVQPSPDVRALGHIVLHSLRDLENCAFAPRSHAALRSGGCGEVQL